MLKLAPKICGYIYKNGELEDRTRQFCAKFILLKRFWSFSGVINPCREAINLSAMDYERHQTFGEFCF